MKSLVVFVVCITLGLHLAAGQSLGYPCNINNCQVCSFTNFCGLCNPSYMLQFNTTTSQFYCQAVTCNIANCTSCYQNNMCATCNSGFYVAPNGTCVTGTSLACPQNCLSCTTTQTCSLCVYGYNLQNGGCFPNNGNSAQLTNCQSSFSSFSCQLCNPNFIVGPSYQCVANPGFNCPISNCAVCKQSSNQTVC